MPEKEYIGTGSFFKLPEILKYCSAKRVLIICGKQSYASCGAEKMISKFRLDSEILLFNDFGSNPKLMDVEKGVSFFKEKNPDIIIAIGGGSSIDLAKLIYLFREENIGQIKIGVKHGPQKFNRDIPFVAIPTTAGSGSEATHFAVLYIEHKKYSISHQAILPHHAIVDPSLTLSLSPYLAGCSGFDALCQTIESYWSLGATKESMAYAIEGMRLIYESLTKAVHYKEETAINNMMIGANLSGKAINISKTTGVHAMSYVLTSHYGIPHGHAVAIMMSFMINVHNIILKREKKSVLQSRMNSIYSVFDVDDGEKFYDKWLYLMKDVGLENSFVKLGILDKNIKATILNNINAERLKNHPVDLPTKIISENLCSAYG